MRTRSVPPPPPAPDRVARRRFRFVRNPADRIIAGVAAGLGDELGIDHVVVRLAFVVLAFAGGAGLVAYLLLWLLSTEEGSSSPLASSDDPASRLLKTGAAALVVGGLLLLLRAAGAWFGDAVVWPVALGALGSAVIWMRANPERRTRWTRATTRHPVETVFTGEMSRGRIAIGAVFIAGGMAVFLVAHDAFAATRNVLFATGVTAVGISLIAGPGMWRLGRQLAEERRERIRSEERAEVAAHLHDSVLQSLAMIQRAESAPAMASLARAQERELRQWLYGRPDGQGQDSLSRAVDELAARVEERHHVRVEAVTVGDVPMDDRLRSMLQACGEAMTNAARHSGVDRISVYVEVEPEAVTAFVRDRGRGFDPAGVGSDRRGISESIVGRMERAGGSAEIASKPDGGTEVLLALPVSP
jgi:signal transduction histidine kinase